MNLLLKRMSYVALITQLKRLYDLPASVPLFSAMFLGNDSSICEICVILSVKKLYKAKEVLFPGPP